VVIQVNQYLDKWRRGFLLDGQMTLPARIEVLDIVNRKTLLKVILKEGRNRQIRRIATLIGHLVQDLQRMSISSINLNYLREVDLLKLKTMEWISFIN
tara:strand:+ start:631 stop:924 length:294 start_codon:yes stop_codon:yes gene_type:complete